eukprot:scaffold9874_cov116-Isochrysis_galbana.AAC.7
MALTRSRSPTCPPPQPPPSRHRFPTCPQKAPRGSLPLPLEAWTRCLASLTLLSRLSPLPCIPLHPPLPPHASLLLVPFPPTLSPCTPSRTPVARRAARHPRPVRRRRVSGQRTLPSAGSACSIRGRAAYRARACSTPRRTGVHPTSRWGPHAPQWHFRPPAAWCAGGCVNVTRLRIA